MREIKFRGREQYGNQWVYGYYVQGELMNASTGETQVRHMIETYGHRIDIDPETVGQYTGLKDKNGKEIYEGDVVECVSWNEYFSNSTTGEVMEPFRRKMCVSFMNGGFKMVEKMPSPMKDNVWDIIYNGDIMVIGNIHDNPELLK